MDLQKMKECGIDYEQGLNRFVSNSDLYDRMLQKFVEDDTFIKATEALSKGDLDEFFGQVHTLKGVSGNLSLNSVYEQACLIVNKYREGGRDFALDMKELNRRLALAKVAIEEYLR